MLSISIITATRNAATTISECLDSVHIQTVTAEHIIVDGASYDSTLDIIKTRGTGIIKIVSEPDKGIYDAMNKGLKIATGEVIGLLNADDTYASKDTLKKVADVFSDPDVEACYGDLVYVDAKNTNRVIRYWRSGEYSPRKFYWGWMPPHPTFFVRRSVYERYGVFNLSLGTAADYGIMLRFLLKYRIKVAYIPEVLVKMRSGGVSNESFGNRIMANRMDRRAWEANGLRPYPWTLYMKPMRKIGQWIAKPPRGKGVKSSNI